MLYYLILPKEKSSRRLLLMTEVLQFWTVSTVLHVGIFIGLYGSTDLKAENYFVYHQMNCHESR